MCMCCGKKTAVGENHEYHRIAEFCEDCNDCRCDAFPGECPNKDKADRDE